MSLKEQTIPFFKEREEEVDEGPLNEAKLDLIRELRYDAGGRALLDFLDMRIEYYMRQWMGVNVDNTSLTAAIQANVKVYHEIKDLILAEKEEESA